LSGTIEEFSKGIKSLVEKARISKGPKQQDSETILKKLEGENKQAVEEQEVKREPDSASTREDVKTSEGSAQVVTEEDAKGVDEDEPDSGHTQFPGAAK